MEPPYARILPFSGIGIGAGLGIGCGAGLAAGIGGTAPRHAGYGTFRVGRVDRSRQAFLEEARRLLKESTKGGVQIMLRETYAGGGCGIGLGLGWGFFLVGFGAPVKRMEDILGTTDRQLDKAMEQLNRDRAEGKRIPGVLPEELSTGDEFLDKVVRAVIVRREKFRTRRGYPIQPKK